MITGSLRNDPDFDPDTDPKWLNDPEGENASVHEIDIPVGYASPFDFFVALGVKSADVMAAPVYWTQADGERVKVDLKKINWREVKNRIQNNEDVRNGESGNAVSKVRKLVRHISGVFLG